MNKQKKLLTGTVGVLLPFVLAMTLIFSEGLSPATAHGTIINYEVKTTIDIVATFDDGLPMPNAEITIFSPEDPSTPWERGIADESGHYTFSPDTTIGGDWDVRVRQAGHGDIISIPISEETQTASLASSGEQTNLQRLIMAAAVIWGFVGTALYFSSRGKQQHAYS